MHPDERMKNSPLEVREIHLRGLDRGYSASLQQTDAWWVGWIDEVAGVNSQGRTRGELMVNLCSALHEALEMQ